MPLDLLSEDPEEREKAWPRDAGGNKIKQPEATRRRRARRSPFGETHDVLDVRPRDPVTGAPLPNPPE